MNDTELKQKRLKKFKRIATGLFLSMVALFITARWLSYYYYKELWQAVAAFAEAGMIGALADWYAVTALFRYPMGIKIPHTNLIAVKKDKFALKMGKFIEQHFLHPETIAEKIQQLDISKKITEWLQNTDNQQKLVSYIQDIVPYYLNQLNEQELNSTLQQQIIEIIQNPQTENHLYSIFEKIIKEKHHHKIMEVILKNIVEQLDEPENRKKIYEKIKKEVLVYVPTFVLKPSANKFIVSAKNSLNEIRQNPEHEFRQKIDDEILRWLEKVKNTPDYQQKVQEIKQKIIQHYLFQEHTHQLWTKLKNWLSTQLHQPNTQMLLQQQIKHISKQFLEDLSLKQKIDIWINNQIFFLIQNNQETVKNHITETIQGWDTKFLSNQIELEVGKDLQYIRINGTLVGGLIGLTLYISTELIPQWLRQ